MLEFEPKPTTTHDFSIVSNPWGPSNLTERAIELFPQIDEPGLKGIIANWLSVDTASIMLGANGSTEIINKIPGVFLSPNDRCAIIEPTYFGFHESLQAAGVEIIRTNLKPENGFEYDEETIQRFLQMTDSSQPKLIWICNPNNPTGTIMNQRDIDKIAQSNPQALVVVDEAYQEMVDPQNLSSAVNLIRRGQRNILVTKTFTKAFGLPGIRTGVAIGNADKILSLENANQRAPINSLSLAKAAAAINDREHLSQTAQRTKTEIDWFSDEIKKLDNIELGSKSHVTFAIIRDRGGKSIFDFLQKRGIKTLDFNQAEGLIDMGFTRVCLGQRKDNEELLKILAELASEDNQ